MPCNTDHMDPDQFEEESKRVAEYIWQLNTYAKIETPAWVMDAANAFYGNKERVHELTAMLCKLYTKHEKLLLKTPYDTRIRKWANAHFEADRQKLIDANEKIQQGMRELRDLGKK